VPSCIGLWTACVVSLRVDGCSGTLVWHTSVFPVGATSSMQTRCAVSSATGALR
jgi:hypothetical protein